MEIHSSWWSFESTYVLQIQTNSAFIEGLVSVVFDLLLIAVCEALCQCICASHNLYRLYDAKLPLVLEFHRVLSMVCGPVGHAWLSRVLSVVLTVCTASVIVLGFGVNGRSEDRFELESYGTVVHIPQPPRVVKLDFESEFQEVGNDSTDAYFREPPVSERLVVLSLIDRCLICEYNSCQNFAYAFRRKTGTRIVNRIKYMVNMDAAECVTKGPFRRAVINYRNQRDRWEPVRCAIERVDVNFSNPIAHANGTLVLKPGGQCGVDVRGVRCFRRPGTTDHCAGVGWLKRGEHGTRSKRMHLMVINDAKTPDQQYEMPLFAFILPHDFTDDEVDAYLDNVAFMASLKIAPPYKLNYMAFAHTSHNQLLEQRVEPTSRAGDKEGEVNVTDVDLRIAVPCITICVLLFVMLLSTTAVFWFSNVYGKGRSYLNTFTTVPEILQLLNHSDVEKVASRPLPSETPAIGIRTDAPQVSVLAPDDISFAERPTWPEHEIL